MIVDFCIAAFSLYLSFLLRFEGVIPPYFLQWFVRFVVIFSAIKIFFFYRLGLYRISWEYVGLTEIVSLLKACIYSMILGWFLVPAHSVLFMDAVICFLFVAFFRLHKRIYLKATRKIHPKADKLLIVGAGDAGQQMARNIKDAENSTYDPVGFIDDDPLKKDMSIHGINVLGPRSRIPVFTRIFDVKTVLIAMPSASSKLIKETIGYCHEAGISNIKMLPSLAELIDGKVDIRHMQDIQPENLLGRQEIRISAKSILPYIKDKTILVTGAGGSIGSQLCRQIAALEPLSLIMLDIGDTELFYIDKDIKEAFPGLRTKALIADVKDSVAVKSILLANKPSIIFHAAAYKHVPIMQANAREAVLNNIEGTKVLAEASIAAGVEKFIFISTDKAINPTSIMGATKRACEDMLKSLGNTKTRFISVRFGNVLESRGSLIPIIKEEIRKGGPVTITDPGMTRYFMSIIEAAYLVLEAGAIGKGGEVFVLDMGAPVKILDMAKEIIRFYGLEPDKDMPIVFTGIRPGEKLYEELLTDEERKSVTKHKKIFMTKDTNSVGADYMKNIERLIEKSKKNAPAGDIVGMLKEIVPAYKA